MVDPMSQQHDSRASCAQWSAKQLWLRCMVVATVIVTSDLVKKSFRHMAKRADESTQVQRINLHKVSAHRLHENREKGSYHYSSYSMSKITDHILSRLT